MRLVLLGPPGAGKGTQAQLIREQEGVAHVSTGDLLRAAEANGTELGLEAKRYMERGELVPDRLVIRMIEERLAEDDAAAGFLLDGFPRNVTQAGVLNDILEKKELQLDHVVSLDVPREELVKRMLGRRRADDNEQTIRARLEVYEQETAPLCDYYRGRHLLREIAGVGSPEKIADRILARVRTERGPEKSARSEP